MELDLTKPSLASYKQKWKVHQDTVYWVEIQLASTKRIEVLSNKIERSHPLRYAPSWLYLDSNCDEILRNHLQESVCVTLDHRRRFPIKIIGRVIWILMLQEAVKTSNEPN